MARTTPAEILLSGEKKALELAAAGASLPLILETLVHTAEAYSDGALLASILLLDREGKHLLHGAAPSLPDTYNQIIHGMEIGPSVGSCGSAAYSARPVLVEDIKSNELWKDYADIALSYGLLSCSSFPILSLKGNVLGVFGFYSRQKRHLYPIELEAIPALVNIAALILDRRRESEERDEAEKALSLSQARLQAALTASEVATWVWDMKNNLIYGDSNLAKLFSTSNVIIGATSQEYIDAIHADDVKVVNDQLAKAIDTGELYEASYRVRGADGNFRWVIARGKVEYDGEGKPKQLAGVVLDVSGQKQAEQDLRISEERYHTLFNSMDQGFCIIEVLFDEADKPYDYRFLEVNPAFEKLSGLVNAVGKTIYSLVPDLESYWVEIYGNVAITAQEIRFENESKAMGRWFDVYAISVGERQDRKVALIFTDITERKQNEITIQQFNLELEKRANFDNLTGLPNRSLFRDRLDQEIKHATAADNLIALLFLDLDRFKEVNDLLGHDAGDKLLVQAAKRIENCVRPADTVVRLGGDEFTIILTEARDVHDVEQISQRIIEVLAQPFHIGHEQICVTGSIGITLYPLDAQNPEDLIRNADQAMYLSKAAGRNQLSFFKQSMQVAALNRLRLINEMRLSVAQKQLVLYFQPIIEVETGNIVKAEALLRWQHPTHGLMAPLEFISIAEETGLINEIGNWVFMEAASWSKKWSTAQGKPFQVSINKSPIQFLPHPYPTDWIAYLNVLGLAPNSISVEITEGVLLNVTDSVTDKLNELQAGGIEVSIDDFGTGFSSLSYLKKLDIDYLKIDQSFVHDMLNDENTRTIAETIIVMAHKLGLKVIAEGVELAEQHDWLLQHGCDYAQGFLYSKPLPAIAFEKLLFDAPAQQGQQSLPLEYFEVDN